jgi:hypothetical protein
MSQEQTVNTNLDTVAKTLASATVAVTALLTALGISTDAVAVAFNNRPDLIWFALGAAVVAVTLSLVALLLKPTLNWLEVVLLSWASSPMPLGYSRSCFRRPTRPTPPGAPRSPP